MKKFLFTLLFLIPLLGSSQSALMEENKDFYTRNIPPPPEFCDGITKDYHEAGSVLSKTS